MISLIINSRLKAFLHMFVDISINWAASNKAQHIKTKHDISREITQYTHRIWRSFTMYIIFHSPRMLFQKPIEPFPVYCLSRTHRSGFGFPERRPSFLWRRPILMLRKKLIYFVIGYSIQRLFKLNYEVVKRLSIRNLLYYLYIYETKKLPKRLVEQRTKEELS